MPLKCSSFALISSPLPPALPTFASLMLHFLFVMLSCISVISYVMIYLILTISWAKHGILLGRPTWWYTPFLLLILLLSLVCCSPTVCHYMVLPFGSSHVLPFTQSRSLLTTYMYSDTSGIFHAIGTPEFNTLLLACPVCLMLSFLGQHPFCHLPSPALLSLFGRFLVNPACWHTPILGIMPCLVAYMPSSTTRRMGYVRQSSVTFVCLGPSRTMTLMRWLILFVLVSA